MTNLIAGREGRLLMLSLELCTKRFAQRAIDAPRKLWKMFWLETTLSMSYIFCFYLHHFYSLGHLDENFISFAWGSMCSCLCLTWNHELIVTGGDAKLGVMVIAVHYPIPQPVLIQRIKKEERPVIPVICLQHLKFMT